MNTNDTKRSSGKMVVIGLVTLVLGVLIGVIAERYGSKSSNPEALPVAAKPLPSAISSTSQVANNAASAQGIDEWDPFAEMRQMQAQMNRMFQRSIERFHLSPGMSTFTDDPGYSLSLDVRDLKDCYEVHAMLPDANASDAKVNLEGNQLRVAVENKHTEANKSSNGQAVATEMGHYEQVIQLADNVKSDQMKVEHKEHELIITIPKA